MTRKRTWLALGTLLTAVVVGAVWAADQEPKSTEAPKPSALKPVLPAEQIAAPVALDFGFPVKCEAAAKPCCEGTCCTAEKTKSCCGDGKCCTAEKGKSCCADGKCCGCCEKGKSSGVTLPILPGSTFELLITPPGAVDGPYAPTWTGECLPHPQPCPPTWCPPPAPMMPPTPQIAPPQQCVPVTQYYYQPCVPVATSPWRLRAIVEKDHSRVEMQFTAGGEDASACCDDMVLKIGKEKVKVSVVDKQLQVHGSFFTGTADSVSRTPADGSVLFEGHVKLTYEKAGQKAEVSAERVVVGIADGRLEVKPVEPAQQQQVFSFWTGFFQ